jgi:hypothetical protein
VATKMKPKTMLKKRVSSIRKDHPTKKITIKRANVDVKIIPLVNWFNSYQSVTTYFCCQGEPKKEGQRDEEYIHHRPYVLFTCMNAVDLVSILSVLNYKATVEIYWNEFKSQIEYVARFDEQERLFDAIEYIKVRSEELAAQKMH